MLGSRKDIKKYGDYTQKPLTVGAFEEILAIMDEIGVDALVLVAMKLEGIMEGKAGKTVKLDVTEAVEAAMKVIATIGKTKALVKGVAALLEIDAEEAARVPMDIVRQVVVDFFTLNASWLPNMRTSLMAARQAAG